MTCPVCVYSTEIGSWPWWHRGTHCGFENGCHRSWAGKREVHCAECHAHFTSDPLAEKHRTKDRCLTRDEMLTTQSKTGKPVFRLDTTQNGEIWRYAETLSVKPAYLMGRGT